MSTRAVIPVDSAATAGTDVDIDFEKFRSESNARDLEKRRAELGTPSTGESATSKTKTQKTAGESTESQTEEHAETIDDSAPSTETAAASEAASMQKKGKTAQTSENRFAKLSRENKDLRERLARLEGIQEGREARPGSQPGTEAQPQPAKAAAAEAPLKPKFTDVDPKTNQPKYKTFAEYEEARDNWLLDEGARRSKVDQTKTQTEQQKQATEQAINRDWHGKVGEARKKYQDFDTVALNRDLPVKKGSPVDVFFLARKSGADVLYYLGKNPGELERINALNPVEQVVELTKIELKLAPTPAKRVSNAPPPVRTVTATSNAGRDEVTNALNEDDVAGYMRAQNARDLAARRR